MIPAIVLAAGASTRMGTPKALLRAGDRTFVQRILDTLRDAGIAETVVVVRPDNPEVLSAVERASGRVVTNANANAGQLSSLIAGLDAVERPGVDAVLVTLIDVPLVDADSVRLLLDRAPTSSAGVIRAVHRGRHGHPVIFKRETFASLRAADPAVGAKAVLRGTVVEDVEVSNPAVTEDVDTPADYARLFKPEV